jgi:hypothetical protein
LAKVNSLFEIVAVLVQMVIDAVFAILQPILGPLGLYTAKRFLPLVSRGFFQVQTLPLQDRSAPGWRHPYKRLPNGRIEIQRSYAVLIGLLIWIVLISAAVFLYMAILGFPKRKAHFLDFASISPYVLTANL